MFQLLLFYEAGGRNVRVSRKDICCVTNERKKLTLNLYIKSKSHSEVTSCFALSDLGTSEKCHISV